MNPSAPDWINKYISTFKNEAFVSGFQDCATFYLGLKDTGFIYGASNTLVYNNTITPHKLTHQELTKVNLFYSLLYIYFNAKPQATFSRAISEILTYYKALNSSKSGFFQALALSKSDTITLEDILSKRVQESSTLYKTNAVSLLTHALLFIDILGFEHWLQQNEDTKKYQETLEQHTISTCFLLLKAKHKKSKYDVLLIDLFESSSQYIISKNKFDTTFLNQEFTKYSAMTRHFIFDLSCLAVWEDKKIDAKEHQVLKELNTGLGFKEQNINTSINHIKAFAKQADKKVTLFEYATPIKQFYKQSTNTVQRLIIRNKDRLHKELQESGELLKLLGASSYRELNNIEKEKVKEQLLDICKSIPSLTIFLLPGGAILLPLLIKFIPKLLPSSFNENRID